MTQPVQRLTQYYDIDSIYDDTDNLSNDDLAFVSDLLAYKAVVDPETRNVVWSWSVRIVDTSRTEQEKDVYEQISRPSGRELTSDVVEYGIAGLVFGAIGGAVLGGAAGAIASLFVLPLTWATQVAGGLARAAVPVIMKASVSAIGTGVAKGAVIGGAAGIVPGAVYGGQSSYKRAAYRGQIYLENLRTFQEIGMTKCSPIFHELFKRESEELTRTTPPQTTLTQEEQLALKSKIIGNIFLYLRQIAKTSDCFQAKMNDSDGLCAKTRTIQDKNQQYSELVNHFANELKEHPDCLNDVDDVIKRIRRNTLTPLQAYLLTDLMRMRILNRHFLKDKIYAGIMQQSGAELAQGKISNENFRKLQKIANAWSDSGTDTIKTLLLVL